MSGTKHQVNIEFQSPRIEALRTLRAWHSLSALFPSVELSETATTHRFSYLCKGLNARLSRIPGDLPFRFVPLVVESLILADKGTTEKAKAPALLLTSIRTKPCVCRTEDLDKILAALQRFAGPRNLQVVMGTRLVMLKSQDGAELRGIRTGRSDKLSVAGQVFTPVAIALTTKKAALLSASGAAELCQQLRAGTIDRPAGLRSLARELALYFRLAQRSLRNAQRLDPSYLEAAA